MASVKFEESLEAGRVGESRIARWLMKKGYSILPVYEIEIQTGKGPRLFTASKNIIAPDMIAFRSNNTLWIEAKHKTAFSWHRITDRWVTGIDLRHYLDYCEIEDNSSFRVWLMFLHEGGQAKDSPKSSPSGLFGHWLSFLRKNENHRSDKWGSSGMVYWAEKTLNKLAELQDI